MWVLWLICPAASRGWGSLATRVRESRRGLVSPGFVERGARGGECAGRGGHGIALFFVGERAVFVSVGDYLCVYYGECDVDVTEGEKRGDQDRDASSSSSSRFMTSCLELAPSDHAEAAEC